MHDSVSIFLHRALLIPDEWAPPPGTIDNYIRGLPPWHVRTGAYRPAKRSSRASVRATPPPLPPPNRTSKSGSTSAHPVPDEDIGAVLRELERKGLGGGGMTSARQAQVEGAIVSMLGGGGATAGGGDSKDEKEGWTCAMCTLINEVPKGAPKVCAVCEHPHGG